MSFLLGAVKLARFTKDIKPLSMRAFKEQYPEKVSSRGIEPNFFHKIKEQFPVIVNEYRGTLSIAKDIDELTILEIALAYLSLLAHKSTDARKKDKYIKALKNLKRTIYEVQEIHGHRKPSPSRPFKKA